MKDVSLTFLKTLLQTPGTSGEEGPVQDVCRARLVKQVDAITRDVHGNQFYHLNRNASFRILLTAHVDQIGLMVNTINDAGFLRICAIGGVDAATLRAQRVLIHGPRGPIPGVIGWRATPPPARPGITPEPHRAIRVDELWVDIGAKSRKEAERVAPVGTTITLDAPVTPVLNERIVANGLDNRIGVFILLETMRRLSRRTLAVHVCGVTTVQEEVGLRGATTAAHTVAPDIGINLDVNFATDHPKGAPDRHGDTALSRGPILARGPGTAPWLFAELEAAAKKSGIPFQVRSEADPGGTDAGAVQISRGGVATADIGIPNRYMHSPVEMVCLEDAMNTIRLLTTWIGGHTGAPPTATP